jgi:BatD DUF11 like domain
MRLFLIKISAIILILSTIAGGKVLALDVVAELSSNVISLDDQATLTIKILESQTNSDPQLPPLNDFTVYNTGRSFSSTYVNGKMTSSVEYSYILLPKKTGKFRIEPVIVNIKGKEYKTKPLTLRVNASSSSGRDKRAKGELSSASNSDYLVDAVISKDTVYEGEQLVYTFRAYQRRGAGFFSDPVYLPPSYSGFWREEFGWRRYNRTLKNDIYIVSEMNSYLFPVIPGEITIEPTRVVVTPDNFSSVFNFDPFSNRGLRNARRSNKPDTLFTKPILLNVIPLPREGRPRDFKGAVGDYRMSFNLSNDKVTVDETVLLTMKITGKGNIKTLTPPDIPEIEGLDIRSSGDTASLQEAGGKIAGSKTFEFSIIPEQEGVYEIPSLKWSYFDPEDKTYKTHKSRDYTITISPGANGSDDVLSGLMNLPGDIKVRDILAVMPLSNELQSAGRPLALNPVFWIAQIIPILALAGVVVFRRRQDKIMGDVRYRRLKRAHGMARKHLASARSLLKSNRLGDFYGEISKAIYHYVGDKFNYSASGMTESQVCEILSENGYGDSLIADFKDLIQSADFGRFAPGQESEDRARNMLTSAEEWIVAAEQKGKLRK